MKTCEKCEGTGRVENCTGGWQSKCPRCQGTGRLTDKEAAQRRKGVGMDDLRKLEEGNQEHWNTIIQALDSGEEVRVPDWVWEYFLGVLPPKWMGGGGFIFAEGADAPTFFGGSSGDRRARRFRSWPGIQAHLIGYGVRLDLSAVECY